MNHKHLILFIVCFGMYAASAQTLFTYGNKAADAKDFLRAFNKNNSQHVGNKSKAINEYLDLYINSKLKIAEAYEKGFDTLPQLISEVVNLRAQIIDNYMSDEESVKRLVKEAFQRSLKDIHTGHIFISFKQTNGVIDTLAAERKKDNVWAQLQRGDNFSIVAQRNSDDPEVNTNKGDIGFITVFTLPYEIETVIYKTPIGFFSNPLRSKIGYHIFKNMGERKAVGKIKAQQILLAIPPGATDATKKQIASRIDSIYTRIIAGENFSTLATALSNDYISAASNGNMPDIAVGQFDPIFENALWSLPKDGAVSKPFLTAHGWHIVKRISLKPVVTDEANKTNQDDLKQKITTDNRWKSSTEFIHNQVIEKAGFVKNTYSNEVLWALTDSLNEKKALGIGKGMQLTTALFAIKSKVARVSDWIDYVQANQYSQNGSPSKTYDLLMNEFVSNSITNYYRDNLEDFNEEFRNQMNEFKDGNLFFEIMQQEIWNKAQSDSTALHELYVKNKNNYTWKQSADIIFFFCSDQSISQPLYNEVKKNPLNWKKIAEKYAEKIVADSSRYEWSQLPNLNKTTPKPGMVTKPFINKNDNTASFVYIIKTYPKPMPRSFAEAKGLVINDYQLLLENQWTSTLRKKYPVVIDKKVLGELVK